MFLDPGTATSLWHGRGEYAGGDHHNDVAPSDQPSVAGIIAADIDPLQAVRCPDPAPAQVVTIVGVVGKSDECEPAEAVMEEAVVEVSKMRPEGAMRKGRARPMRTGKARPAKTGTDGAWPDGRKMRAHPAGVHAAHPASPSTAHPAMHAAATKAAAASVPTATSATTTAAAECGRSQGERSHHRTGDK